MDAGTDGVVRMRAKSAVAPNLLKDLGQRLPRALHLPLWEWVLDLVVRLRREMRATTDKRVLAKVYSRWRTHWEVVNLPVRRPGARYNLYEVLDGWRLSAAWVSRGITITRRRK